MSAAGSGADAKANATKLIAAAGLGLAALGLGAWWFRSAKCKTRCGAKAGPSLDALRTMPFGRDMRAAFALDADPNAFFLNHGSYGTRPRHVGVAQEDAIARMERSPDLWFRDEVYPLTRAVLARVAKLVHCDAQDLVFVPNATTAMHAVWSSLANTATPSGAAGLRRGDSVLILDLIYPAVKHSVIEACERSGATIVEVPTPLPVKAADDIVAAVRKALDDNKQVKVALFDHITSSSGLVLPVAALSALCRERGVMVVIDAAHAVGHVPIDLQRLDVDFYCSNFHKWLFAPKGSCFLYARRAHQAWLQPVVTSHEWKNADWTKRFNMQGTNDASAYVATGAALDFVDAIGWPRMDAYRRDLLEWVVAEAGRRWGAQPVCPASMRGYLALVTLPLPETDAEIKAAEALRAAGATAPPNVSARSAWLMTKLLREHKVVLPIMSQGGKVWCRFSAQIYNSKDEYTAVMDLLQRIVAEKAYERDPTANVLPNSGWVNPSMEHVRHK